VGITAVIRAALGLSNEPAPSASDDAPQINPLTIGVGLDEVRRTLDDEEQRGRHLDSKALQILGFVGVIFTLTATLGGTVLTQVNLGSERVAVAYLFVSSLGTLLCAAVAAVLAVRPAEYFGLDEDALEKFGYEPRIYDPPWQLEGDILLGLIKPLRAARIKNDAKARWVKRAAALVVPALVVVAAEAAIVGLHASKVLS
jgi:hypothetical protein